MIDHLGELRDFDNAVEVVKEFCDYRVTKYTARYEYLLRNAKEQLVVIQAKIKFIEMVIAGKLDFKNKNKNQIRDDLANEFDDDIIDILIRMPIYALCQDESDKLKQEGVDTYDQIDEWKKIDVNDQFIKELKVI